ncbi:MAG TPA: class I SAM-dependent methyltransferase [Gemmatimonadales bacterium]|nr:class I SAM-dependent methyltransferase [Gemmatimonadales bacterium]
MDPSYGVRYEELYRRHWWWRAREAAILLELRRLRPPGGFHRILDVGCGNGLFFDRLRELGEVEGVEPDVALLDPEGPWRRHIHAVPFDNAFQPGHRFGAILMLDVLEHLDEPAAALRHAVSLLGPGGVIICTVPAFQWLWTSHDVLNHHRRRYNRPAFRALAAGAGLRITRERFLFQWLVAAKLLVRAVEHFRKPVPQPPGIPPEPLNGVLRLISRIQERVTSVIPVPWGGSLMVSGRSERDPAGEASH